MNPPGEDNFFDRLVGRPRSFWFVVLAVVIVDICWDYFHPLGVLFDVILIAALFGSYLKSRNRADRLRVKE
jgi:hypothetical protein